MTRTRIEWAATHNPDGTVTAMKRTRKSQRAARKARRRAGDGRVFV